MTLFAYFCIDCADSEARRADLLEAHLAHVEAHIEDFAIAGPLKHGDRTIGSLIVIKASDEAEARAKFEADPYFAGGVWESITSSRFLGVAGDWVGGAAWKR